MIAIIGSFAVFLGLVLSLYGVIVSVWAGRRGARPDLMASARHTAYILFGLTVLAAGLMITALVTLDFSIRYVANNTSRATPLYYRVTGLWGALEGSIILWALWLTGFTALVGYRYRGQHRDLMPTVMGVFFSVCAFFFLVMTVPANPFARVWPVPPDGRGLNVLLEDTYMFSHPPVLYLGFVGFTVPYAFAIAALVSGRLTAEWAIITRRWTVLAWYFLSLGNILGAWWSYHVLGWGGYWAWDPVENAAIMPWIMGTAFLHSVMIQERRDMLKVWNLALIILTFSLTLFGTFLTRSGVVSSVHAFSQSSIGGYFLAFLALVLVVSLSLLVWRSDQLRGHAELDALVCRESAFLLNNVALVGLCFAVFLGTIFPLLAELVRGVKVSVGAPFFNQVSIPLLALLLFLMGAGPLVAWRRASLDHLRRILLRPLVLAALIGVALYPFGRDHPAAVLTFALCAFVVATVVEEFWKGARARQRTRGEPFAQALGALTRRNRRRYGGLVVHVGVVLLVVGVAASSGFSVEREVTLKQGESMDLGRYQLTFTGLDMARLSNHHRIWANVAVSNQGEPVTTLQPARKHYERENQPLSRAVMRSTLRDDLYVILTGADVDRSTGAHLATLKVLVRPLVIWMWIGGLVLTAGTVIAVWPDRRPALAPQTQGAEQPA
jgi:cytochrome c-type biogenesis protein CcmF